MNIQLLKRLGKRAYFQSLKPYRTKTVDSVAIFGLDSEYVPKIGERSEFICWQLASEHKVSLLTSEFSLKNLYREACLVCPYAKTMIFAVFFSIAEIQFLDLADWQLSEYKGKYRLRQTYKGRTFIIMDLYDWYPKQSLAKVSKLWGLEKQDYPIGEKVEAIAAGKSTIAELMGDPVFVEYAKNDAVLCQKICTRMREYFLGFGVDIILSMTPAQTSAFMFRSMLTVIIDQHNTSLRKLALKCCWGGRMECIFRGEKNEVYEYDATGHHPSSVIALNIMPAEKDWKKANSLKQWLSGISGLGKVYFKFPNGELYPCLPVFHADTLIFPLEDVSYCSVSEARLALKMGASLILLEGYFYTSGTSILAEYLKGLQDKRNVSGDAAYRQLLKLLSNSIIGKFFQKRSGIDLAKVQKYADEHKIPYEQVLHIAGLDFGQEEMSVGSCFYPEWYGLILGYARATISDMARTYRSVVISSDSFITEQYLGASLKKDGIEYNLKASGDYVGYRTRFYRVGEKIAHHAVHNRIAGKEVLNRFRSDGEFRYHYERLVHLKEAWRLKTAFGSRLLRNMSVGLGFDYKRRLLEDGSTVPWQSSQHRADFLANAAPHLQGKLFENGEKEANIAQGSVL